MIDPKHIIKYTEKAYFIPSGSILNSDRTRTVAEARAVAMYLTKKFTTFSYPEVSRVFARDHSTVIYNCKKIVKKMEKGCNNHTYDTTIKLIDYFCSLGEL